MHARSQKLLNRFIWNCDLKDNDMNRIAIFFSLMTSLPVLRFWRLSVFRGSVSPRISPSTIEDFEFKFLGMIVKIFWMYHLASDFVWRRKRRSSAGIKKWDVKSAVIFCSNVSFHNLFTLKYFLQHVEQKKVIQTISFICCKEKRTGLKMKGPGGS